MRTRKLDNQNQTIELEKHRTRDPENCDRACKNRPCAAKIQNRVFIPFGSVKYAGHADIFLNFIGQSTRKL